MIAQEKRYTSIHVDPNAAFSEDETITAVHCYQQAFDLAKKSGLSHEACHVYGIFLVMHHVAGILLKPTELQTVGSA